MRREILLAARRTVDDADNVSDRCAEFAQPSTRVHNLATGRHDIFDDYDPPAAHLGTLCEPTGTVVLGLLPDEGRWDADHLGQTDSQRHTAELEPGQDLCAVRHQASQLREDCTKERWVRLESVLVEVLRALGA